MSNKAEESNLKKMSIYVALKKLAKYLGKKKLKKLPSDFATNDKYLYQ